MRLHFIRTGLVLLLVATSSSQKVTSAESLQIVTRQHFDIEHLEVDAIINNQGTLDPASPILNFSTNSEVLTFQRSARLYSWRGRCYAQNRDENWYQVDALLC
jgi:hypothetical protein